MTQRQRSCLRFGLLLLSTGCAGRFDPAHFEGTREPRRAEPEALFELVADTAELQTLGSVRDHCTLEVGYRALDDVALSDLDCSSERLMMVLRESASAAGGDALVGAHCSSRLLPDARSQEWSCAARVARFWSRNSAEQRPLEVPRSRPPETPAPSAKDVKRIDEPDASLSFRIRLDFSPRLAAFSGPARPASQVRDLPELPVSHYVLGDLAAHCDGTCELRALRYGVLVAAARLGAPDVVGVRCFRSKSGDSCVGTLAAPERDEQP